MNIPALKQVHNLSWPYRAAQALDSQSSAQLQDSMKMSTGALEPWS